MKNIKSTQKNLLKVAIRLALIVGLVFIALPAAVHAVEIQPSGLPNPAAHTNTVKTVMGIAFGIIGAFAFLNIVLSGFKYITSAGDPQKTSEAKNGVVFAVIGLMLAVTAEALVVFIIKGSQK